jgi:hypothetical protein
MSIAYSAARLEKTIKNYEAWWRGELDRPLVPIILNGRNPGRSKPTVPLLTQATVHEWGYTAEQLIDRWDYELSSYTYLGDSFPMLNFDLFGPGILGAFLGAVVDNSTGRIWFHKPRHVEPRDLHFTFDEDNRWFLRIIDLYKAGQKRWQGQVVMGMADLGGVLDILATFLGTEELMMAFIDEPEEIKRLAAEIESLWRQYFNALSTYLDTPPGATNWTALLSQRPMAVFQSDVSYMMGQHHFREFVLPELKRSCQRVERSIYHLDGVGELKHLDDLLAISELDCIQWIPGAGMAHPRDWPEVYKKIRQGGKKLQIIGVDALQGVMDTLGSGEGIDVREFETHPLKQEKEFKIMLEQWGIEA